MRIKLMVKSNQYIYLKNINWKNYASHANSPASEEGPRRPHRKYRARAIWKGEDQVRFR